jgi:hypothetical protein
MKRRTPSPASIASSADAWPVHLRLLVGAAERECPPGHASALRELIALALTKVPARGIFDPTSRGEHELFTAFETIASRHLGRIAAQAAWRRALRAAHLELEARDTLEHAALRVRDVSDTTYFYAGLAFGLACGSLYRPGP